MAKKTISVSEYGVNPFTAPLVVPVTKVTEKDATHYIDRRNCAKLYQSVQSREILCNLSPMACRLLLFITQVLEPAQDYIKLDPETFMLDCTVKSAKSYYNAINELHDSGIINPIRGKRSMFWINPAIIFCGSVTNKFPENMDIKQTWRKP
jgi:hypothetical protein